MCSRFLWIDHTYMQPRVEGLSHVGNGTGKEQQIACCGPARERSCDRDPFAARVGTAPPHQLSSKPSGACRMRAIAAADSTKSAIQRGPGSRRDELLAARGIEVSHLDGDASRSGEFANSIRSW
jgi:hypothetical protein